MRKLLSLLFLLAMPALGQRVEHVDNVHDMIRRGPSALGGLLDSGGTLHAEVQVARYSTNVPTGVGSRSYLYVAGYSGPTNAYGGALSVTGGAWVAQGELNIADFGARPDVLYDNAPHIQAFIDFHNPTIPPSNHSLADFPAVLFPKSGWVIQSPVYMKKGAYFHGEGYTGSRLLLDWSVNGLTVDSLTQSGGTITLDTVEDHGFASGDFVLISGADQTEYNEIWQVTVTDDNSVTLAPTIDAGTTSPATGSIVVTKHPFLLMNWVEDNANEFANYGDFLYTQNNFGWEHMTIMPQNIDTNYPPPDGVWVMRLRAATEPLVREVRFPIHLGSLGTNAPSGAQNRMNGIWAEGVADFQMFDASFDQGMTHLYGSTRFSSMAGTISSLSSARVQNNYFYSAGRHAIDLDRTFTALFEGNKFLNLSHTSAAGHTNDHIRIRETSTSSMFYDNFFYLNFNRAVNLEGTRNTFSGNRFHAGPIDQNTSMGKTAFLISGDYNYIGESSTYGLYKFVEYVDGAETNVVKMPQIEQVRDVVTNGDASNPTYPNVNPRAPSAWVFPGNATNYDFWQSSLNQAIGADEEFSIYVRTTGFNQSDNAAGTASMLLLHIGNNATPAAGSGGARLYVSFEGELLWQHYGATSSDWYIFKTDDNTFQWGQQHDVVVSRASDGSYSFSLDGYLLGQLQYSENGTNPATNAAVTGTYLSVGGLSGIPWNGTISDVAVFNRLLTYGEVEELRNGTMRTSPKMVAGRDETTFNGTFEVNTSGWGTYNSGTITRTNASSHGGTWSLEISAGADDRGALTVSSGGLANTSGLVQYEVTFWAQWISGTTNWIISRQGGYSPVDFVVPDSGTWTEFTVTVGGDYPVLVNTLRIASEGGAGVIRIDDVTVKRLGALAAFSADAPIRDNSFYGWDGVQTASFLNGNDGDGAYVLPPPQTPSTAILFRDGGALSYSGGTNVVVTTTHLGQYGHTLSGTADIFLSFSGNNNGSSGRITITPTATRSLSFGSGVKLIAAQTDPISLDSTEAWLLLWTQDGTTTYVNVAEYLAP